MENDSKKSSLRKVLLERRDSLSHDFIKIASRKIVSNLMHSNLYRKSNVIASYSSIGSEVNTTELSKKILSDGKTLLLPKTEGKNLIFKKILDLQKLEEGEFGIMEPKDEWQTHDQMDLIIVPAIGLSPFGDRLGYGHGYYDRYLLSIKAKIIALTYSAQIVKSIPTSEHDVKIDWIVTEEGCKMALEKR